MDSGSGEGSGEIVNSEDLSNNTIIILVMNSTLIVASTILFLYSKWKHTH